MADDSATAPLGTDTSAHSGTAPSNRMKAIALMCAAVTLFSCLDAMAKYIAAHSNMGTAQIVWLRFLGQMLLMAAILGPMAIPALLNTEKPTLQALRSLMLLGTTAFNFLAVKYLRLDQTISIAFLAPLVVAALAGPILGEWVGWRRALAIVAGFIGVLIVVRPGIAEVHWAFGASFLSMLCYATFMIATRKLSTYDQPLTTLFLGLLAGAVALRALCTRPLGLARRVAAMADALESRRVRRVRTLSDDLCLSLCASLQRLAVLVLPALEHGRSWVSALWGLTRQVDADRIFGCYRVRNISRASRTRDGPKGHVGWVSAATLLLPDAACVPRVTQQMSIAVKAVGLRTGTDIEFQFMCRGPMLTQPTRALSRAGEHWLSTPQTGLRQWPRAFRP